MSPIHASLIAAARDIIEQMMARAAAATPTSTDSSPSGVIDRGGLGWDIDVPGGIRGMFERREDALFHAAARADVAFLATLAAAGLVLKEAVEAWSPFDDPEGQSLEGATEAIDSVLFVLDEDLR